MKNSDIIRILETGKGSLFVTMNLWNGYIVIVQVFELLRYI